MNRRIFSYAFAVLFLSSLMGCASVGPSVVKTYNNDFERGKIAILRADKSKPISIIGCDGIPIYNGARYILLEPGRHEIWFNISGQTLFIYYRMSNKKYLDVIAGHTYILKTKLGKLFDVGDKWFPEAVDVTNDINLHLQEIPQEIERND